MSSFGGDPNFCPECGNILPLPGILETVCCPRCSFCIPVAEFSGQEIRSTVTFNKAEQSSLALEDEKYSELKGPIIDRRCSRCNKEGMVYHARQMRSADEGQTVFFTCTHCSFTGKESITTQVFSTIAFQILLGVFTYVTTYVMLSVCHEIRGHRYQEKEDS